MEENVKKKAKSGSNIVKEFKDFINKGSVVDLAVGVIVGAAFGKIVSSLVNDILMPIIGTLMGGLNFSSLAFDIGGAHIAYGSFIQNIVDFLIIAFCIFLFVKLINKTKDAVGPSKVTDVKVAKKEDEQLTVLKEIRDSLNKK